MKPHSNRFMGALHQCILACGGYKQVGAAIWPNKAPDAAQRSLLNCLNEDRAERLSPDQVMQVLRMARDKGVHTGMGALCELLSYAAPVPLEPQDEADQLRREVLAMGQQLQATLERLNAVDQRTRLKAV